MQMEHSLDGILSIENFLTAISIGYMGFKVFPSIFCQRHSDHNGSGVNLFSIYEASNTNGMDETNASLIISRSFAL